MTHQLRFRSQVRSPLTTERSQGHWLIWRVFYHICKSHGPTVKQLVVCSPHPSQLPVPRLQVKQGEARSCQCGAVNRHPWWSGCSIVSWGKYRTSGSQPFPDQATVLTNGLCDFLMTLISHISQRLAFMSSYIWEVYAGNAPWRVPDPLTPIQCLIKDVLPRSRLLWANRCSHLSSSFLACSVLLQGTSLGPRGSVPPGSILSGSHVADPPKVSIGRTTSSTLVGRSNLAYNWLGRDLYGAGTHVL